MNCMRRAQAACSMHAQEGSKHRPGAHSERGGIVCASRPPPRRLGGVEAQRTKCREDWEHCEDLQIKKPPRAAPEEPREEPREVRDTRNSPRRIQSQLTWHEEQSKGVSSVSKSAQRGPKIRPKPPESAQQAPKRGPRASQEKPWGFQMEHGRLPESKTTIL